MSPPPDGLIQPIKAQDLIAGESYDTWICAECLSVIALGRRSPDVNPHDMPDALIRIPCPQCGVLTDYSVHARCVRKYPWTVGRDSA
jgi:hypothetical protein